MRNNIKKIIIKSFVFLISFSCLQTCFGDIDITTGAGDVNLPGGGGVATAASDVIRTGQILGADGDGYWSVTNYGTLTYGSLRTIYLQNASGGTVTNSGTAQIYAGDRYGIRIDGIGTVTNRDSAQIYADIRSLSIYGGGTVTNRDSAQIYAGNNYGIIIHGIGTITNSGTISAGGNYGIFFNGTNTADVLYNSGTIRGNPVAVSMGSGDDLAVLQTGSQVYGILDGGTGTDTLKLEGSGTLNNSVQNFEVLEKNNPGIWGIDTDLNVNTTTVNGGTLALNSGGTLNSTDMTVNSSGTLSMQGGTLTSANLDLLDGSCFEYHGGNLNVINYNFGVLGGVIINSPFDFSENLNVNGPVLINNTLTTPQLTIYGNGSFYGNGRVNGSVTNYGILSPGNSIGTLTVSENYNQTGGSYVIETSPDGSCDKLNVSGHSVFNNTELKIYNQSGHYYAHTVYEIVNSSAGVSGTFTLDSTDLTPLLYWDYKIDSKTLSLEIMRRSYTLFTATPNQLALAHTLDAVENKASGDFSSVLDVIDYLNQEGISYAMDEMSPASSDVFAGAALASSYYYTTTILNHLNDNVFRNVSEKMNKQGLNLWVDGFHAEEEIEGTSGISGYEYTLTGISAGVDKNIKENLLTGISFGISDMESDKKNSLNQGETNSMNLGAYAQWKIKTIFLNAVIGYAKNSHEGKRYIQFSEISRRADIEYDSDEYFISLGAGKSFKLKQFSLGFFDSITCTELQEDGYTETGADSLNLKISGRNTDSFKNDMGVRITLPWTYKNVLIMPEAEISWLHEFKNQERTLTAGFENFRADTFSVKGVPEEADLFHGRIGLSLFPGENFHINTSFEKSILNSDKSISVWRLDLKKTF